MAKKNGLYPDILSDALKKHYQLALRSELHGHYADLFVDHGQLDLLERPDWQVVYGRRGTGKTLLLGVQRTRATASLESIRVLPIAISAQECIVSPAGRTVSDATRALGYFQVLLELMTTRLLDHVGTLLGRPSFIETLTGARKRRLESIQSLALEVVELAELGRPVVAFADAKQVQKTSTSRAEKHGWRAKVGAGLETKAASMAVSGERESTGNSESLQAMAVELSAEATPRVGQVRHKLLALLDAMEIKRLLLHIDEWSSFDPSASTAIQPEIGELLKRAFSGTDKISVKIATNRYQTRFSNRAGGALYRGLEMNADIFEATNLDHAIIEQTQLRPFYERLLFKRLMLVEPRVKVFERSSGVQPDEQFISSIFADHRAFEELVRSAEGVPRDFLIGFNELSKQSFHSVRPLWDVERVRSCIRKKSVTAKQNDVEYHSEADQLLTLAIKPVLERTGSRFFLVRKTESHGATSSIDELLEKRIIHEAPYASMNAALRRECRGFVLDYGLWLDWERALGRRPSSGGLDDSPLSGRVDSAALVVDVHVVKPESVVRCAHCQAVFPADSKAYVVRKLCASCFLPADG